METEVGGVGGDRSWWGEEATSTALCGEGERAQKASVHCSVSEYQEIQILYDAVWICTLPTGGMYWVAIPYYQAMSRGQSPREISRSKGMYIVQPNTSRLEALYGHSLSINPSLGTYQEIHPYWASSIDSVKINNSLVMRR